VIDHDHDVSNCCAAELDDAAELDHVHENRPGLPTISYRLGRHGDFLARMLKRLPNERNEDGMGTAPPLGRLTYRGQDDPTVALLDACSSLLDVLAFYQERIANETFMRTATERRSVLELARSIGYEMRPGVAASTLLAFTVDDAPGSPERVVVPVGTQVLSIPKKDELPQTFETVEPVEARVEWNQLGVQVQWTTLAQTIETGTRVIFVDREGPRVARGDALLLTGVAGGEEQHLLRRVDRVTDFPGFGYRKVELQPTGVSEASSVVLAEPQIFTFGLRARFFGQNAARPDGRAVELKRLFVSTIGTPVQCVALASQAAGLAASGFAVAPSAPNAALIDSVAGYHHAIAAEGSQSGSLSEALRAEIEAAGRAIEAELGAANQLLRRTIRIWNLDQDREERALDIEHTISALAFSNDDLYLAATTHDRGGIHLHVWKVSTGALVASGTLAPAAAITQEGPVRAILFRAPDDSGPYRITTIDARQRAVLWDLDLAQAPGLRPVQALDLSPLGDFTGDPRRADDGGRSLTGDEDGVTTYRARSVLDTVPEEVILDEGRFDLDKVYQKLSPEGWVLLADPRRISAYSITGATTHHRSDFGISKRVTRVSVDLGADAGRRPAFSLRETEILAESEQLALATVRVALPEPIQGKYLQVAEAAPELVGRTVIVRGRPVASSGPAIPIHAHLTAILPDGQPLTLRVDALDANARPTHLADENGFTAELETPRELVRWSDDVEPIHEIAKVVGFLSSPPTLELGAPLQHAYDWRSVQILGNVAPATHGESVSEVLGSGDGLIRNQRFKLGKPPLTFVPAPGVTGRQSTLQIRVNGVLWAERDSLLQLTPADEVFAVRIQNDGSTELTFGDGVRGARLPSGTENVVASYRSGLGAEGDVEAGQLALLKTKPLGIREVTNPIAATGAEPPEMEAETRENAPRTVLVLGRVVSIQDYEDFSKTFPGVGKAQAVPMWDGFSRFVHLTIGTEGGAPIERGTPLYESLLGALDTVRDTHQLVIIDGYQPRYFGLGAKVLIDQRYEPAPVFAAIRRRLQVAFSYHARDFGQDVTAAELVAAMHEVAGVVAIDLDALDFVEPGTADETPGAGVAKQRLEANLASLEGGVLKRAELLLLHPDVEHIQLETMT
jgi:hypothetical protein